MTRQEALAIADKLKPRGFRFNSLALSDAGQWVATFIDDQDPPEAVVERWEDIYTVNDPDPDREDDGNGEGAEQEEAEENGARAPA